MYIEILYSFFWVIPRRLNFIGLHIKFRRQKKAYNIQNTATV
jgi:hypothetical protein